MTNSFLFVRLFWRDVKSQKKRMVLTILAVLWGTLSIVLLLAFGHGLERELTVMQKGLGDGIIIIWGGQTTVPFQGLGKGRRVRFMPEDIEYVARRIPEIKHLGGEFNYWSSYVSYGDKTVSLRTNGCYPNYEEMRAHYPEPGGRFIDHLDMEQRRRVAFVGWELRETLFNGEDPVGKTITINRIPFTVVGVMAEKQQMGSYSGPDYNKVTVPATTFQAIWGHTYFNNIVVKPWDPNDGEYVKRRLYEVFGQSKKFDPDDKSALAIWDVIENQKEFAKVFLGLKIFFSVMGFFSLSIAGVGVANIMYAAIKKRTTEIGVKMALGAKKRQIMGQFVLEALLLCGVGGVLGIAIAQGICMAYGSAQFDVEWVEMLGKPSISLFTGIVTVVILAFIGLTSGYFPARKAASVDPVESLRYE